MGLRGLMADLRLTASGVVAMAAFADAQETTRISVSSSGVQGDDQAWDCPVLSMDAQIVAFVSSADNLVSGDTNGAADVFIHDRATATTERVSIDSAGAEGNAVSGSPAISADGQVIAFVSQASNLVANDQNGFSDVFVHDRSTGLTERVSVDSAGQEAHWISDWVAISADGRTVAFVSVADNLVAADTNQTWDVFVHDRSTGITERVSVDSSGVEGNAASGFYGASISSDGRIVAFNSFATNLVSSDTNQHQDIFVHDRSSGLTERISVRSDGHQGNRDSNLGTVSADGGFVVFHGDATTLVSGDTNNMSDVFVHDRATNVTERVSVDSSGAQANYASDSSSISSDGQFVAFSSFATNLVAGDTNGSYDVFVHDRSNGITQRVSVDSSGTEANSTSSAATISADGHTVVFDSYASNLVVGDTNGVVDVFIHDGPFASWSNYGTGYAGTNGIPAFTSRARPVIGTTITLDLANSYAKPTAGLLFLGFQQANLPTNLGGDLLVAPALVIAITFSYGADSFTGAIPDDPTLAGTSLDLQALEADPGAAMGVSFTSGLELVLGY